MEVLFDNNIIVLFVFAAITIFDYSAIREYQKIAIIYMTAYALSLLGIVSPLMAIAMLCMALFCYLEILPKDEMKFRILVNPVYKCVDCVYLMFAQYGALPVLLSIALTDSRLMDLFPWSRELFGIVSFLLLVMSITTVLQQKFVVSSFSDMYRVFRQFPIYRVKFDEKLEEAGEILTTIEDVAYWKRKGYTFLSFDAIVTQIRFHCSDGPWIGNLKYTLGAGRRFVGNVISGKRGYSTIPMQLIRSLGIQRGYNYTVRRKIYELLYSRMFFEGMRRMFLSDRVSQRGYFKEYLLYIYFHQVNTFLGDASFSKFLNAFDMQYGKKNKKDIYDCSNEGIFIACMGLSKRALKINENSVEYYTSGIEAPLDHQKICNMVDVMMDRPYGGNYLK